MKIRPTGLILPAATLLRLGARPVLSTNLNKLAIAAQHHNTRASLTARVRRTVLGGSNVTVAQPLDASAFSSCRRPRRSQLKEVGRVILPRTAANVSHHPRQRRAMYLCGLRGRNRAAPSICCTGQIPHRREQYRSYDVCQHLSTLGHRHQAGRWFGCDRTRSMA
jgi:hypothetical protein